MKTRQELIELMKKEIQFQADAEDDFNTGLYNFVSAINQGLKEMGSTAVLINKTSLAKLIERLDTEI